MIRSYQPPTIDLHYDPSSKMYVQASELGNSPAGGLENTLGRPDISINEKLMAVPGATPDLIAKAKDSFTRGMSKSFTLIEL